MEMILVWLGSGFALAVGFTTGMIVMAIACRNESATAKMNAASLALLKERNDIGKRQADALESLAARHGD